MRPGGLPAAGDADRHAAESAARAARLRGRPSAAEPSPRTHGEAPPAPDPAWVARCPPARPTQLPGVWDRDDRAGRPEVDQSHRADGEQLSLIATSETAATPNTAPPPPVPKSLQETGLGIDQIERLLIKTLYGGEATGLA